MELFKFKAKSEPVRIYARVPQHVIDLVDYYKEKAREAGQLNNLRLAEWVRNLPKLEEIVKVDEGIIKYHIGMLIMRTGDKEADADLFCERMQVTDDFEIAASPESVFYFERQRQQLPTFKRKELYKFQVDNSLFEGLYFIPEDVMAGIINYDLTPHLERAIEFRSKIERVKAGHSNLV